MVENLANDHRMLSGVRQNLQRMEPILISLSQQTDARFFSERQPGAPVHGPHHQSQPGIFIQRPARLCAVQKTLDNAVNVLIGSGGEATQPLRACCANSKKGWARDEHRAAPARGRSRTCLAARRTAQPPGAEAGGGFLKRIQNKKVPEIVVVFLRGPWAQVVAESQLRCADGTVDADGYLALVDDLIWSVQTKLARRNRARLVDLCPVC